MTDPLSSETITSLKAMNAKLLAALKHAHDSEVDGWLDEEEPSWMTEASAVIAEAEARLAWTNRQLNSNELLMRETAAALAHRACCGTEHDTANGKLHGYCVVCGVPWPCDTAKYYLRPAPETPAPRRHSRACDCHDCHYAKKHPQVKPHHTLCGCFECAPGPKTTAGLVREIAERHDRVSKLLWGPGALPGTILGPMDSDAAHADRGRLLSLLTPEQRGELKANEGQS